MKDSKLFEVLNSEIENTKLLFDRNGQILKENPGDENYSIFLRNKDRLSGKIEALEDLRTKLVFHGFFTE